MQRIVCWVINRFPAPPRMPQPSAAPKSRGHKTHQASGHDPDASLRPEASAGALSVSSSCRFWRGSRAGNRIVEARVCRSPPRVVNLGRGRKRNAVCSKNHSGDNNKEKNKERNVRSKPLLSCSFFLLFLAFLPPLQRGKPMPILKEEKMNDRLCVCIPLSPFSLSCLPID